MRPDDILFSKQNIETLLDGLDALYPVGQHYLKHILYSLLRYLERTQKKVYRIRLEYE